MTGIINVDTPIKAHCPICKKDVTCSKAHAYATDPNHKIAFCDFCKVGMIHPYFTEAEIKELYEGSGFWGDTKPELRLEKLAMPLAMAQSRWKFLETQLKPTLTQQKQIRFLDIGAGQGLQGLVAAQALGNQLESYTAIEPDPKMANHLKKLLQYHLKNTTQVEVFSELKDLENSLKYDVIVLSHVLEHIQKPQEFLKAIQGRLNPKGILFIEIPNHDYRYKKDFHGHVLFFSPAQLNQFLTGEGFKVLEVAGFGKDPKLTPMSDTAPPVVKLAEKIVFHSRKWLPLPWLKAFYSRTYGLQEVNPEGTWVRAVVQK